MNPEVKSMACITIDASFRTIEAMLTHMILATPTGEERNKLTDVNMHVMAAAEDFKKYRGMQ
jgi:hypothetical protein